MLDKITAGLIAFGLVVCTLDLVLLVLHVLIGVTL